MKKNIRIDTEPLDAMDLSYFLTSSLEIIEKRKLQKGYLKYNEQRLVKTFKKIIDDITSQIDNETQEQVYNQLIEGEDAYNKAKNN